MDAATGDVYKTIYEIGPIPENVGGLLVFFGVGVAILAMRRRIVDGRRFPSRAWVLLIWGAGTAVLGGIGVAFNLGSHINAYSAFRRGDAETVEGVVEILRRQPESGHAQGDLVQIAGRKLEIDYFGFGPGYRTTAAHGGVLVDDQAARIAVWNGRILRVEIPRSAFPATSAAGPN